MSHTVPHILVVDDEADIRIPLARYLERHGLRVSVTGDGSGLRRALAAEPVDLVVLDIMLPGEDGLTLCRHLRESHDLPVILLTALGEETDRIVGLEVGADDYVTKPFNPRELLARIKAVLRRVSPADGTTPPPPPAEERPFQFDGWTLDPLRRLLLSPAGVTVSLSGGEFALLRALLERPGVVLTRDRLLDLTQGRRAEPYDRAIDNQVMRLRRKIEPDPGQPRYIHTVRGAGYCFAAAVTRGDPAP